MNRPRASTQSSVNADPRNEVDTLLHGHWLVIARVVWIALIFLTLGVLVVLLPAYFAQLRTVCTGGICPSAQLNADTVQTIQEFDLSVGVYAAFNFALTIASISVCFAVAGVIYWRKSEDWMALLVALGLVLVGTVNVTYVVQQSGSAWRLLALVLNVLSFGALFLVFSLFPNGQFVPPWTRWLTIGWVMWSIVFTFFRDIPIFYQLHNLVWLGVIVCLLVAQIYRYRRVSSPIERQQTKWIIFDVLVSTLVVICLKVPPLLFPSHFPLGSVADLASGPAFIIDTLLFPLVVGIAILRYRLYDIDLIINRTLVYGTLTTILAFVYVGLVITLQFILRGIINQSNGVAIVGSTLVIAALFQPLRHRIQASIDRRFYRRKYDAAKTLAVFSATLRNEVDLNQLCERIVAVVEETVQPSHVSLWLLPPEWQKKQSSNTLTE